MDYNPGPQYTRSRVAISISLIVLSCGIFGFAAAPLGSWSVVSTPSYSGQNHYFLRVRCNSRSDCWGVGFRDTGTVVQTLVEHWNGSSWSIVAAPNTAATQDNYLYDVACSSETDCWAVGHIGGANFHTLIEHWDGISWVIWPSPGENMLWGITCVSASNCWAVGFGSLVEHWNGKSWNIVSAPDPGGAVNYHLVATTCTSETDCWAVGFVAGNNMTHTLTLHWNGSLWSVVPSPDGSPNESFPTDNQLTDISCTSASDCWAVGYYNGFDGMGYANRTLIERWDGLEWKIMPSPNRNPEWNDNYLQGVTCLSPVDCWAVGTSFGSPTANLIQHWDGNAWTIVDSPPTTSSINNLLYGVSCTSVANCWAVGFRIGSSPHQTLAVHYLAPPPLETAVSRKLTVTGQTFDVDLSSDSSTTECRTAGGTGTPEVDYKIVFTFGNDIANCGSASVGSVAAGPESDQCTVNLSGVSNQQRIAVTLNNVSDSDHTTGNVTAIMPLLIGDVNGDGFVNSADISQTKSQSGSSVTESNFRGDLNSDGVINSADISAVKSNSGIGLSLVPSARAVADGKPGNWPNLRRFPNR